MSDGWSGRCALAQKAKKKSGAKGCTVHWFELDTDAACSSLTHARALQPKFTPKLWLGGLKGTSCHWAPPERGSSQAHQPCTSSRFPLKACSRTHAAFCKAGIPNLPMLLFSMYNKDYGLIPASQGGAVGIERVKALR